MLEGFEREPEEDDGMEEAVQTMSPEDLQREKKKGGGWRWSKIPTREEGRGSDTKECGELLPTEQPLTWGLCARPALG